MKRFAWILLISALVTVCPGCKVHEARFTMHDARYMMHDARYTMHDIARDSICEYARDSMAIRTASGRQGYAPDTVIIDRWHTTYRDRWRVHTHTDTVIVTHTDTVTIRAPVPRTAARTGWGSRFYRTCTLGFFLLLIALIAFIALRPYLRR